MSTQLSEVLPDFADVDGLGGADCPAGGHCAALARGGAGFALNRGPAARTGGCPPPRQRAPGTRAERIGHWDAASVMAVATATMTNRTGTTAAEREAVSP